MTREPVGSEGHQRARRRFRRRIAILPSMLTVANIFCGFYAIIATMRGEYDSAAKAIGWAWVCDTLDGKIARLMNATSDFGLQLDSLADIISFGVAPALLAMAWGMPHYEHMGWMAAFVYIICGAMRLARFNSQGQNLKRYFVGMPIPAAGCLIAATVHFFGEPIRGQQGSAIVIILVYSLSLLMVSTIRYPSLKFLSLSKGNSHLNVLLLALIIAAVYLYSQVVLLTLASSYAISGVVLKVFSPFKRKPTAEPLQLQEKVEEI